jgi:SAM-dependent methyltransferase
MKKLLHVGCGTGRLPEGYETFLEFRLDCDPTSNPDIVASAVAMPMIADESYDLIFASHVMEHLHFHEVALALAEFHRVLKPGGIVEVFVPDLQAIGGRIAMDELDTPVYLCGMGPIAPMDMIYGHRASIAKGESAMAHKTGFTGTVLKAALGRAGFEKVGIDRDKGALELRAKATKSESLHAKEISVEQWAGSCLQKAKPKDECSTPISATPG